MKDIIRVHFRKKGGERSTVSLDKIYSDLVSDFGYKSLNNWVQATYDRLIKEYEAGTRASLDKSLSREIQKEAVLELRRHLNSQKKVIEENKEEKKPHVSVLKHIVFSFERIARDCFTERSTFDKLDNLRQEFKLSADHYKNRGWSIDDKKLLIRLSQAINEIRKASKEEQQKEAHPSQRCEAQTSKKNRCKARGVLYVKKGGNEYLACKRHATWEFEPFPGLEGREEE